MQKKSIAQQLADKSMCMSAWARNRGLSSKDRAILSQLSCGKINGTRKGGRAGEILQMLRAEGLID